MIHLHRGDAPLIVSIPHAGLVLPDEILPDLVSPDRARRDTDANVDRLYGFAQGLGASVLHTEVSRTAIDVNRDPSGASLYPGRFTTGLCPTETFDGDPLYRPGREPSEREIARRRAAWFAPYHAALAGEIDRMRRRHPAIVLYEAHSIRSVMPRLFAGTLPVFNLGTNAGAACAPALTAAVEAACDRSGHDRVTDGRFQGGWTTRHYGRPDLGVHAIQMELAMRFYCDEADPHAWHAKRAAAAQAVLRPILSACIAFARNAA